MSASPEKPNAVTTSIRPPHLIQSLVGGFNAVANNIALILLPVGLDLLLWFGPHLRVKTLFTPALKAMLSFMRSYSSAEMRPMLQTMEDLWTLFLERYNLLSSLNTFPVGVPSQMVGLMPVDTPAGPPPMFELTSFGQFFAGWLALTLVGFALGSLYFAFIARACSRAQGGAVDCPEPADSLRSAALGEENPRTGFKQAPPVRLGTVAWETMQVIALVIVLLILLMILMIPAIMLSTFLIMINPVLAQFALLLLSFSAVWLLVPLVFSPHGIFLCGQSVFNAMLNSSRVVRLSLPGTGLFLLTAVVLHQGLGVLWNSPPENSWLALVGIFGRAFISTALLAASFFYYRSGLNYLQALRRAALLKAA